MIEKQNEKERLRDTREKEDEKKDERVRIHERHTKTNETATKSDNE